ncbi:hypothetical protein [Streptomyces sp. NPDC001843]|uniref:effector-associated constant component EACC1 n=1 Tax=Streptomyces sp. NPDC001843 TaxID=3364617 RepID=UPI003688EED2
MATALISVRSEDPVRDAESLTDWLRGEPALAGKVRLTGGAPRPGQLGTALDTVTVLLGAGGPLTVLASCLRAWITQPRRSDVRLKVELDGGRVVEIDAKRVDTEDVERLLRQAREEGPDPDARD